MLKSALLLLPMMLSLVGCATAHKPMLKPYYASILKSQRPQTTAIVRVTDLTSSRATRSIKAVIWPKAIFPLVGFIPTTDGTLVNTIPGPPGFIPSLQRNEAEHLLVAEIKKCGVFSDATYGGKAQDYEIKGSIDFKTEANLHQSGLGIFYHGLLPMFILPNASYQATCDAHFDVISTQNGKVIFSKNYQKTTGWWKQWPAYNSKRVKTAYGEEVYPRIVKQFLTELDDALKAQPAPQKLSQL